ncbi:HET-domain-containing protein [Zopfia rhizophila CBS 207.26]|uniref:HET-domain-containing protein n=1 Tax=Zopfia rhizophila CBS 207.26 TaxID=1314779 RepID=A0A6A6DKX1_9PEZI|nr:HET-domain-containing protein [Zopfia rhizophila CBS 207.26]
MNIAHRFTLIIEPLVDTSNDIKTIPSILQVIDCSGSAPCFQLLREWLRKCDQDHRECSRRKRYWPTRVILVGGSDPNKLKLQERANEKELEDYIVLSHCWGTPTDEEKERFCTTSKNYDDRVNEGFSYDDLPKTFQDAVRVTQELKKEYLWIDSLCIIQGDENDWENEAGLMEKVFASAYCTIAASSAPNWGVGFLKQNQSSQYIQIQDISGKQVNVCDFNKDVDEGPLNKRAWVLQERVLSCRTIHFSAEQTYWECGEGVRCENLTRLKCPTGRQYFVLDPNFPKRLTESGYDRTVDFVQYLFEKYSRCGLTNKSDRDTAISGLVKRIESALDTKGGYGVFRCFFSRLLLWKQSDEEKAALIDYKGRKVPSWSWMAYNGGIDFMSNSRLMAPNSEELQFDREALTVKVRQFKNCRPERYGILADSGRVGSVWFDTRANNRFKHCVVVGMRQDEKKDSQKTYYILIVKKKLQGEGYERLGVGEIEARYVSKEGNPGKLV